MLPFPMHILAISGSTRRQSANGQLIQAIAAMHAGSHTINVYDGLDTLPHFNPDTDPAPPAVVAFRDKVREADAVLICTPEYAMGVPGTLKNALDWTVASMEFSGKPVALITASLSGEKAHQSLLGTLLVIESKMTTDTQLLISYIKSKLGSDGTIKNDATADNIKQLMAALEDIVTGKEVTLLQPEKPSGQNVG